MANWNWAVSFRYNKIILFPDCHFCACASKGKYFFYIYIFHRDAAESPVFIPVYYKIFMRPGAMYTNATTNAGIAWYLTSLFSLVKFFTAFLCGIVKGKEAAPFLMNSFTINTESSFRCIFIAFHFFICKTVIAKHYRVSGIPSFFVKYTQFVIWLINNNGDSSYRSGRSPEKPFIGFRTEWIIYLRSQQAATQENGHKNNNVFHQLFVCFHNRQGNLLFSRSTCILRWEQHSFHG